MYTYGSVGMEESSSHLLGSDWDENPGKSKKVFRRWKTTLVIGLAVALTVCVAYFGSGKTAEIIKTETAKLKQIGKGSTAIVATGQQGEEDDDWSSGLSFITYNDYTKDTPITWTTKWEHLAEPYRPTTLEALCSADETSTCDEDDHFIWKCGEEEIGSSRTISFEFTRLGIQYVTVEHQRFTNGQLEKTRTTVGEVMVKYVRREIRTLFDCDREKFLDALEIMYRVEADDGKRIYGTGYTPMSYFISMHLMGAGVKECDGWHDDAGIATNHVGVTLAVEQALQVIDPSITIPYWDHTIDAEQSTDGTLKESDIFRPDWFGANAPNNSHEALAHVVTEGRWAFTPVLKDAYTHVHNPYGLLRSPWNTSPVPFLQRYDKTNGNIGFSPPTCSDFEDCFDRSTFAEMQNCLNGGTHGPVHILIGGEWGLSDEQEEFLENLSIVGNHPLFFKALWRMGFMRFPEDCTTLPADECTTTCPEEILDANGYDAYDVLLRASSLKWITSQAGAPVYYDAAKGKYTFSGLEGDEDALTETWKAILQILCTPGVVGEMYTSAAPQDPTFWIIHPSMERFLGQKFRTTTPGDSWDRTWGYLHQNDPGDDGYTCDWTDVKSFTDLPTCTLAVCFGHHENDLRPFALTINGETKFWTNREILDLIVPESDDLPYMYDNYDWPSCAALGIMFD